MSTRGKAGSIAPVNAAVDLALVPIVDVVRPRCESQCWHHCVGWFDDQQQCGHVHCLNAVLPFVIRDYVSSGGCDGSSSGVIFVRRRRYQMLANAEHAV